MAAIFKVGGSSASRLRLSAEPNVVPFIDVLLVLLIVFMVTAPQATVDHNIDMPNGRPLPSVIAPTIVDIRQDLSIVNVSVGGERVAIGGLAQSAFDHARNANPDLPIEQIYAEARLYVRADQAVAYGNVVRVMDELQRAHFAKVGIFAQQAEEG